MRECGPRARVSTVAASNARVHYSAIGTASNGSIAEWCGASCCSSSWNGNKNRGLTTSSVGLVGRRGTDGDERTPAYFNRSSGRLELLWRRNGPLKVESRQWPRPRRRERDRRGDQGKHHGQLPQPLLECPTEEMRRPQHEPRSAKQQRRMQQVRQRETGDRESHEVHVIQYRRPPLSAGSAP